MEEIDKVVKPLIGSAAEEGAAAGRSPERLVASGCAQYSVRDQVVYLNALSDYPHSWQTADLHPDYVDHEIWNPSRNAAFYACGHISVITT